MNVWHIIYIYIPHMGMRGNTKFSIHSIGLGTLYQHKFDHNSSPFDLSIIVKIFRHNYQM